MLKVQTISSPRRDFIFWLASALSAADELASGYSPPTPYPVHQHPPLHLTLYINKKNKEKKREEKKLLVHSHTHTC